MDSCICPEHLFQHIAVAWILIIPVDVICYEIEKSGHVSISCTFGLLFSSLGDPIQESENFIRKNIVEFFFAKISAKFGKDGFISSDSIFFSNGCGDRKKRSLQLW